MRALISVSDKTGVVDFAKGLRALGWEVIATGGTMKLLADSGVEVINISDVTGFPEICDGRVKTLHPNVHGGLLARRDDPEHLKALKDNNIEFIDMVCVNLYPFRVPRWPEFQHQDKRPLQNSNIMDVDAELQRLMAEMGQTDAASATEGSAAE